MYILQLLEIYVEKLGNAKRNDTSSANAVKMSHNQAFDSERKTATILHLRE